MEKILVILGFLGFCLADTIFVSPIAKVHLETTELKGVWDVKGCTGCKLVFFCQRKGPNCDDVDVVITHSGKPEYPCSDSRPEKKAFVDGNEARITIRNSKDNSISCNVMSTAPYIDSEEILIDSSEHGMPLADSKQDCRCGWANKNSQRIVGGSETSPNEYPFAVLLGERDDLACGGSIITPFHILTAAHCVEEEQTPMIVSVGNHKRSDQNVQIINVSKRIVHEDYNPATYLNDIALLYLEKKIEFSDIVGPVCLPKERKIITGEYIKVMGWGRTGYKSQRSNVLKKTYLKVLNQRICQTLFPQNLARDKQLCAYTKGTDSCLGDSGGPLVIVNEETNMYTQYGVVSFGFKCNTTSPGVNTDVSAYLNWIEAKLKETDNHACH